MAPIFASEDIAALVASFQPLSVIEGRPLLVRSRSGNSLVRFDNVLARCKALIEKEESRIEKANLTTILGVEHGIERRILNDLEHQPWENKDGLYIIPSPTARKVQAELTRRVQFSCLDLRAFTREQDVSLPSLERLILEQDAPDWRSFEGNGRQFLCSAQVADGIKTELRDAIGAAGTDICDLPSALSDEVPLAVLKQLGNELASEIGGEIRPEGDHVVYVPSNYSAAVEEKLRQIQEARSRELFQELEKEGYCIIEPESSSVQEARNASEELGRAVAQHYQDIHADKPAPQLIIIKSDNPYLHSAASWPTQDMTLIITPYRLEKHLETMKAAMREHTKSVWENDPRTTTAEGIMKVMKNENLNMGDKWKLSKLIALSDHHDKIRGVVHDQVQQLNEEDHQKLVQLIEARLIIPLQLYTAGINSIEDATLKQHLEDFVTDHFRLEVVPQVVKAARDQRLLSDRSREREVDKFRNTAAEAKTLAALQTSVSKLQKKLKIEATTDEVVKHAKYRTLQAAVKSMRRMSRGSDVLQNLIWIMLARHSEGLFMSSGKDTSRMIKQYANVGDAEMAAKLSRWRDLLKAGEQTKDDIKAMQEAAKTAAEELSPILRRKSSVSSQHTATRTAGTRSPTLSRRKSSYAIEDVGNSAPPKEWQP
ncbi:hypothetical protein CLAFUW4_14653 [Fulvia fulva]|uniref:Uncharacterized protein n=1 Tax=Passalora fulva TaxID=5499 RepID=A0A9Q8UWW5_PASFU|nr:uncharacterized protein CLAFUR5_14481 [Fulvia fulva]KAK4609053.1 hypothetical protein CLAFUR4_14647 [Fulvia fulva]KAK4609784.1 hypothetical protein CLAFUR0_14646 [Fulvia fulva]UJO25317.1 hypothetical protein CLAFUR5_14481 [Fulvia fulva]WPV22414.1 hypothetical protein CLAFUW4_14653 [Fulvia fulva]WPV37466.1 hypothetical protein CLAFUW7_14656 [Fulvia fulva]